MKRYIFVLIVLTSSLLAYGSTLAANMSILGATDSDITMESIGEHDSNFTAFDMYTESKVEWVRVELLDVESGVYVLSYGYDEIGAASFKDEQEASKFTLYGTNHISFRYNKGVDSSVYYLHLLPTDVEYPKEFYLQSEERFYLRVDDTFVYLLFAGVALGLIFMTAIYNGALYYYNRESSFLYYCLMQIFMVGVLLFNTAMPQAVSPYFVKHQFVYEYLSLLTALFAILFARSFLDTKRYLPQHDRVFKAIFWIYVLDMIYYPSPLISNYGLFSISTIYFVIVGYLRVRQGYKPAYFYIIGWTALMFGILVVEYFWQSISFDTMLLGSSVEAVLLAVALAYKIQELHKEKQIQKELLLQHSKLAAMGEMLGSIAHQWRQPLTNLSYILMNIEELDDRKERLKKIEEGADQIEFMSQTIDDFRDFYAPDREKEYFDIVQETQSVINLIDLQEIEVVLDIKDRAEILNYKNGYKQVLLNLLSNAKEVLIDREIKEPKIVVTVDRDSVQIEDNAGGVKAKEMQRVFEPYYSTKESGVGIGLYMSKVIVEKNMKGSLSVRNCADGAVFKIEF